MKKLAFILVLAVATLAACQEEPINDSLSTEQGSVAMSLNLSVQSMSAGTAEAAEQSDTYQITKSAIGAAEPLTTIQNLWVAQFGADGYIVSDPAYINDYQEQIADIGSVSIPLIPSGDDDNTIVYIANTFNDNIAANLGSSYTLDTFKAMTYAITTEQSNFGTDGTDYYAILSGEIVQKIGVETVLTECKLKRNVAKINITIVNNTDGALTFLGSTIQGVPQVSSYFPNIVEGENFPADNSFSYTSYAGEEITNEEDIITFYVPVNMRGEATENTLSERKNYYATPYSTAVSLLAEVASSGKSYIYTFYLGEDLISDFNIENNKIYNYTLTFNTVGDPNSDLRIEEAGGIDFSPSTMSRSNCYILNPSGICDNVYTIPIDRIDEFWGNSRYNSANVDGNTLAEVGDNWEAVILWYDYTGTEFDYNEATDQIGEFKLEEDYDNDTVIVTLPKEFATPANHCNVVFVVRKTAGASTYSSTTSENILWSWHLWITDYDPYPDKLIPSVGLYQYIVGGGELHRYNYDIFNTGVYSDKFIMDRNIGARSATAAGHGLVGTSYTGAGNLHYQFGRHSPYPAYGYNYTTGNGYAITYSTSSTVQFTFAESVQMPYSHLRYSGNWCSETDSESTGYLWNDYKVTSTGKSIFDPSPWGFRVPVTGTWAGFTGNSEANETNPANSYTFLWTNYFTEGAGDYGYGRLYNGFAFYPASGNRYFNNAILNSVGSGGYYWSATPYSSANGYFLYFSSTGVSTANNLYRAYGAPVRPVQE